MFSFFKKYGPANTSSAESQRVDTLKEKESPEDLNKARIDNLKKKIASLSGDLPDFSAKLLSLLAKEKEISQGVFFIAEEKEGKSILKYLCGYAIEDPETATPEMEFGDGFPGQVAKDGKLINISDVPDGYISIVSGLGKATPASIIIFPVMNGAKVLAVIELASFQRFSAEDEDFFLEISSLIANQIIKMGKKK